jgi:hypothetical protein
MNGYFWELFGIVVVEKIVPIRIAKKLKKKEIVN